MPSTLERTFSYGSDSSDYIARADELGMDLGENVDQGRLNVIYLRPLELSVDEALLEIQEAVSRTGARRLATDSLSGFELVLAPTFREDFRESLYRMVRVLTGAGVTVFMIVEVAESFTDLRFSLHQISFLTDVIILQRYVELEGQLRNVMAVVKLRGGDHSRDIRLYNAGPNGIVVGPTLRNYRGIISGVPTRQMPDSRLPFPGLTDAEFSLLESLDEGVGSRFSKLESDSVLQGAHLTNALERLILLGYALRDGEGSSALYRSIVRPSKFKFEF